MIIHDGFSTIISLGGTEIHEKTVTPPGISGGGANDTTTMRNTAWRTKQPKKLKSLTDATTTCAYDPVAYDTLLAQVNVNQEITYTFADGSTLVIWGWLDEFKPNSVEEGSQPTAEVVIIPSNQDDAGDEAAPVYTAPAGT